MRAFIDTFKNNFKYLWKDPIIVFVYICFPIVLILILGSAFQNNTELDPIPIAVVADNNGDFATYLQNETISQFFDFELTDKQTAEEMVSNGDITAAIIEENGEIKVLSHSSGGMMAQVTRTIVEAYTQMGAAIAISAMQGNDVSHLLGVEIEVIEMPVGGRIPRGIDYYAVTMLVMILLFTGINGLESFNKGLFSDTGRRMLTTPASKISIIGGLLAASVATSFIQGLITVIFTGTVYGVYWGERIPIVILTLFAVVLFSQAFCIALFLLMRNTGACSGIMQASFFIMTFISGGYMRIDFGEMERIFQFAPNAMAQTVIFGSIYGGNEQRMFLNLTILFSVAGALFIAAFLLGRRKIA